MRPSTSAVVLAERLCRPQRIGVFGHRGVGKTTLLTMLYREAVGGRLPDLRLAAGDARTAEYLSGKILQLESGEVLPATLAETELSFHLYHQNTRIELVVKDYQGEHLELGREEPIHDFMRDCDALWICLDAVTLSAAGDRLRRQQEVEQLMEDYLKAEPQRTMDRPVLLVLTKADLVGGPWSAVNGQWTEAFDMTRHALQTHCPRSDVFAVSSLGEVKEPEGPRPSLQPRNLAEPLAWLASALQAQDEARLAKLWTLTAGHVSLLQRCVDSFARRYPDAPATALYRQRLRELQRRRLRRRGLVGMATAACLLFGLWTYDLLGRQRAAAFENENDKDPAAALTQWQAYQSWHPTRHVLRPALAQAEEEHLRELGRQAREQQRNERLTAVRRQAVDPDVDPEAVWQQFQTFRADYPEADVTGDLEQFRTAVKSRRDAQVARRAQRAYDDLLAAEERLPELPARITRLDQYLADFAGSTLEKDARQRRDAYVVRLEERDIETARNYSTRNPLHFQTRREHYQAYLDKHPDGVFTSEATAALRAIESDWDKHDFRVVRDHFLATPSAIPELVNRCRSYLAVHPQGRFTAAAGDLLRWSERITAPGDYRVVLRSGHFDKRVARFFSLGPDLSVEIEVGGVRYGPSNIVKNSYDPEWDYEFPRRIHWKLGDPIRVRVTDHDWKDRVVVEIATNEDDRLTMYLLSGEIGSGPNHLTFESDCTMPTLPKIEE